jgi:L-ribulose-5-phosphate 3-epimerase
MSVCKSQITTKRTKSRNIEMVVHLVQNIGFMQGRLSPIVDGRIQSFPHDNWVQELALAPKLGLNKIEWTVDYWKFSENPIVKFDKNKLSEILKLYCVEIVGVTCDCFMHFPFWKCEADVRKTIVCDLIELYRKADHLNVKYLVIPLVDNGRVENYEQEMLLVDEIEKILSNHPKAKTKILFESDYSPEKLARFMNRFSDELRIGVNYDTGNSAACGYNTDLEFDAYGKFIKNIHIKDRLYRGTTTRLGFGSFDFENFPRNLKSIQYNDLLIYQTARATDNDHLSELQYNHSFFCKLLRKG